MMALIVACNAAPPAVTPVAPGGTAAANSSQGPDVPPPLSTLGALAAPTLPEVDAAIPQAQGAEVAQVHDLQGEAGIADLLGADGVAALAAIDEAQAAHAESTLPGLVDELGIGGSAGRIASVALPADFAFGAVFFDWQPTYSGRTAYTASMMTAVLAQAIGRADTAMPSSSVNSNTTHDNTTGDIRERTTIRTTMTLQTGQGRIRGQVELVTTTDATSVSTGAPIGTLVATATGEIDINACPDAAGVAEGKIAMEWQEDFGGAGSSAGASASFDAPIRMLDGDDAHLIHTELNLSFAKGAHGPGTPGGNPGAPFDWNAAGSMSVIVPRSGQVAIPSVSVSDTGEASTAQAAGAATYALTQASLLIYHVAAEAEKFWRGGKCVEVTTSEDSQDVDPGEELTITVDATHKFGGGQVMGKAETTFTGKDSIQPTAPIDTPDDLTFTAGEHPGDQGKLAIKHTGKRGIGEKTVTFTVAGGYSIAMQGTLEIDRQNRSTITVAEQKMAPQDDSVYVLETSAAVSGTHGLPGCVKSFTADLPIRIEVRPDTGSDPPTANVRVSLKGTDGLLGIPLTCHGATTLSPVALTLWANSFVRPNGPGAPVLVDEPTTWTGPAGGTSTVVTLTTGD